jgi:hypothetical protein
MQTTPWLAGISAKQDLNGVSHLCTATRCPPYSEHIFEKTASGIEAKAECASSMVAVQLDTMPKAP